MRAVLTIAGKDLRQRFRDRSAIVLAFVAPLVLALIIGSALGSRTVDFHATVAVADEDGGPVAAAFVGDVLGSPELRRSVTTVRARNAAEAAAMVDDDEVEAAFVVPRGYSSDVIGGGRAQLRVLTHSSEVAAAAMARGIADEFTARLNAVALAVNTAVALGQPPPDVAALARQQPPVQAVTAATSRGEPSPASYFGPAMAMFFLFFTVGMAARSLFAERANATLGRLLAAPIPASAVLLGKALASFVLGLVSMLVVVGTSAVLLGANWGDPTAVLALVIAVVLFATSITWLVATFAKTEEQAMAAASVVAMLLSLLGGNFFPIDQAPQAFRQVALLTPNGRALRAFADLDALGGGLSTAAPHLAVILAVTVVVAAVASARSRRLVMA